MSDSLFEFDEPQQPVLPRDIPIRPEQVEKIRSAFDAAGISSQEDRQALIESVVIRTVSTVRDLHAVEARRVIERIKERTDAGPKAAGSAWDTREEDTWIDKL
ncbi:MAG: hypothetical protein ACQEXN_15790 [Actinomycetota bacterium]